MQLLQTSPGQAWVEMVIPFFTCRRRWKVSGFVDDARFAVRIGNGA
jgi:hypothetical protein